MKNSGISRSAINPRYQAQIAAELGEKPAAGKPMIRQDRTGLNKTEAAFLNEHLLALFNRESIYVQSFTLKLANGVRYTPDFVVWQKGSEPWAFETKGFMRDDAAVKLKVAAIQYPRFTFHLVRRKSKTGGWDIQRVLP